MSDTTSGEGISPGADPDPEQSGSDEGTYEQPGAYTNADGTTGYSGTQSDGPSYSDFGDFGDDGDYPASNGAALAVLGIGGEFVAGGVIEGAVSAALISKGAGEAISVGMMIGDIIVEGGDAFFGD